MNKIQSHTFVLCSNSETVCPELRHHFTHKQITTFEFQIFQTDFYDPNKCQNKVRRNMPCDFFKVM